MEFVEAKVNTDGTIVSLDNFLSRPLEPKTINLMAHNFFSTSITHYNFEFSGALPVKGALWSKFGISST